MSEKSDRSKRDLGLPLILIALGIFFLVRQFGGFSLHNWWALFILIPAVGALGSAISLWEKHGRFTNAVWNALYGGMFPLAVALIFLLDLRWGDYWPVFIIIPGFGALINGLPFALPKNVKLADTLLYHRAWSFFIGLGALVLGFGFLGLNLNWFESVPLIPFENWWGVPILIAALGGVFVAGRLLIARKSMWLVMLNLAGTAAAGLAGVIAVLNLDWEMMNMVTPILLIIAGIAVLFGFGSKREKAPEREKY